MCNLQIAECLNNFILLLQGSRWQKGQEEERTILENQDVDGNA